MSNNIPTDNDKRHCVVLFRYRILNERTVTHRVPVWPDDKPFVEIEIDHSANFAQTHADPRITRFSEKMLEVRVFDENAIDLGRNDLLGDSSDAQDRCEEALKEVGFTVAVIGR